MFRLRIVLFRLSGPMRRFRAGLALLAALAGLASPASSLFAAAAPLPSAVATLLRGSGLPAASFGIDVRPIDGAESPVRVAVNAEQPFLLASTTKLVTSLAALDLLGADHRWVTAAHATGPLANGRLAGDLVISGGDVGLTATEVRRWFAQMHDEGLVEVAGNIVLENVALLHERDPAQVATTTDERAADEPMDGRTFNLGKLLVSVRPSASGERAIVTVTPRPANVVVVNDVLMGGGCAAWARWRTREETRDGPALQLWVRGRWDAACPADDIAYVQPPPNVRLAPELGAAPAAPIAAPRLVAELWREAGGRLKGQVIESRDAVGLRRVAAGRFSSEVATPLAEVMREMNKTSNNVAARNVLRALADDTAPRGGALASAQARIAGWLRTQGLGDGDVKVDIGSGQSRAERGRPRAMVDLLRGAWRSATSQAFVDSLPIAGVDGTLVNRMRAGPASGQAFLKTGTLSDTRALAGYVRGRSGRIYAVAAIVTHPEAAKGTRTLDALIEWVARDG